MKSRLFPVLALALLATPISLFAASKNSQTITLSKAVTVGGTTLPAGEYKIQWDGVGNVTATITHGKKVVATVPATVTETKSSFNGALDFKDDVLQSILWKNATIAFDASNTPAASTSGN